LAGMTGPAALVSVGYMDPGNWATDLEGGARFGYQLLWVLLASNLVALLLQSLSAKLGTVTGYDLASACRRQYAPAWTRTLWVLAELAIIGCDLAEILGGALALNMLFGLPLQWGAALTACDALLILTLQRFGARTLEAVVIALTFTIAVCLLAEVWMAKPAASMLVRGVVPHLDAAALPVAVGMLGATVMPHNLYLHSALVPHARPGERSAQLRRGFWSTMLALNLALLVNVAILVLAAAAFHAHGIPIVDLRDAHRLLDPLLGASIASTLLAVGLLCASQSATVSGTLAGQVVMDGFLGLRMSPFARRVLTRGLAIGPALAMLGALGDEGVTTMLVGSQVLLSLQLPFAIVPLIKLTSSAPLMGAHVNRTVTRWAAIGCATLIVVANAALIRDTLLSLRNSAPTLAWSLGIAAGILLGLLGFLCLTPLKPAVAPQRRLDPPDPLSFHHFGHHVRSGKN
ncbi:MAG: Nramp family divalent metal transporter, partial [Polyangiales bacterium]